MKRKKILIVDDNESLLDTYRSILETKGFLVETALTGREALSKAKVTLFDLIILDIVLPDIKGDKVATELKKSYKNLNIIFITGYPSFQDCINALDIGVYEILLKPIEPEELLRSAEDSFKKTLENHHMEDLIQVIE